MGQPPPKGITLGVYTVVSVLSIPEHAHVILRDESGKVVMLPINSEDASYFNIGDSGELSFTKP